MLNKLFAVPVLCAALIVASAASPRTVAAQTPGQQSLAGAPAAVELGPRITRVAFQAPAQAPALAPRIVDPQSVASAPEGPHGGLGTDLALAVVGVVGTVAGIKIGGAVGGTIAVAGAAAALYGLYRFLQ